MPSKPASNNNQSTSSTTNQTLPDWLNNASANVVANASTLGTTPGGVQPLPQYTAAPLTDAANTDIQGLQNGVGSTTPGYNAATGATSNFLGYTPQQVSAGSLSNTDLSPYLNPYTQTVINSALPLLDQQRQQANNQTAAQAVQSGAFGGSREGVAEGVNNSQSALNAAQLAAQLQSANFSQAQGAATTDLNRNLTAQQSNQSAGLQGAGIDLGAAQQLGNLTSQGQTANQAGLTGALAGQTQLQQQNQADINAPIQDALQRQGVLQSAVGSVPYGTTQNTTSNGPGATSNPWLTGLGASGHGCEYRWQASVACFRIRDSSSCLTITGRNTAIRMRVRPTRRHEYRRMDQDACGQCGRDLEGKLGRPSTASERYLAHQQGPAGAAALLQNPDAPAADTYPRHSTSPRVIRQAPRSQHSP